MKKDALVVLGTDEIAEQSVFLQEEIQRMETEIKRIQSMIDVFASKIRSLFSDEIIEEQELSILYRELQRAKKAKRRAAKDKQRGAKPGVTKTINFSNPESKKECNSKSDTLAPSKSTASSEEVDKKRLYREAMLQVHPDKFALEDELEEKAAEITRTLIEIYQSDDTVKLKQFHAFIMSGQALSNAASSKRTKVTITASVDYLMEKKQELEHILKELKEEQLYVVLTTYDNPMAFMSEIRAYFDDRLMKLRKRTRKARK